MNMTKTPHSARLSIRAIKQMDNYSFQIDWNDGSTERYHLEELQKHCPCAKCVDESSCKRLHPPKVEPKVQAVKIWNVGRYALKIQFTSGCSTGIYSFEMLHKKIFLLETTSTTVAG